MQFILLMCLGLAIKLPSDLGHRAALDGGWYLDWISSTDIQQVINQHVNCDRWTHCGTKMIKKEILREKPAVENSLVKI